MGESEMSYLATLEDPQKVEAFDRVLAERLAGGTADDTPAVIATSNALR